MIAATAAARAAAAASPAREDFAALQRELAAVPVEGLTQRAIAAWDRRLAAAAGRPRELRLAIAGNLTLELLRPAVRVLCAREGLAVRPWIGAPGRYAVDLLERASELARFAPEVALLVLSLRQLRPEAMGRFAELAPAERRRLRDEVLEHVLDWVEQARRRLSATLLVANFPAPPFPAAGLADAKDPYGETELHAELNLELLRRLKSDPRTHLFDLDRVTARFGRERARDERLYYLAKSEWSQAFLPQLGAEVARALAAVARTPRKCLVLDLDDTLWGGVVGEEGPAGIRIGPGDPEGEAFLDFQARLKGLARRGVLLAVCSKNNREDALEAFARRPEMPLRPDDFAALAIDWRPKIEGLREIAANLGIGLDSLVFLDDNPAEVALVQQALPEVEALLRPADPSQLCAFLDRLCLFERPAVLAEDLGKAEQYRQQARRRDARATCPDLRQYLSSLGTQLRIAPVDRDALPRAHQLLHKTNQFNLTTRRHALAELEAMLDDPRWELWSGAVRDRFGDLGMVVLALLEARPPVLHVDTFLMSCRAIGREVESAFMNHLKDRLLARTDCRELQGVYLPTPKNRPAEGFYPQQGFAPVAGGAHGPRRYRLDRSSARPRQCPWIEVSR